MVDTQYYSSQNHGLPMGFHYDQNEVSSTQSPLRALSYDGFPKPALDQQLMTAAPAAPNLLPEGFRVPTHLSMSQPTAMWSGSARCSPGFDNHHEERDDYGFEPSYITARENYGMFARGTNFADVPRTWEQYNPRLLQQSMETSFEHGYVVDKNDRNDRGQVESCESNRIEMDYCSMAVSQQYPALGMSNSPIRDGEFVGSSSQNYFISADGLPFDKPTPFRMPSSSISDDGNISTEMTAVELDEQGADEPYAKLIYRALMSVPNRSMVLQEIYQWFRDHTSKGSSESKGWMNSIRHNLSMNAAFKKTERKNSGDDTKKSTEWVLEDFAIKDGVQSTTRYRKGAGNKKFSRSESPAASRQRSGRKGGSMLAKSSSARFRRKSNNSHSSVSRIDTFSQAHLPNHHRALQERQRSPLTPPHHPEAVGPYYFQKVEQGYDLGFEGICGLEGVEGVHIDGSPVFATADHDMDMDYRGFPVLSNHEGRC